MLEEILKEKDRIKGNKLLLWSLLFFAILIYSSIYIKQGMIQDDLISKYSQIEQNNLRELRKKVELDKIKREKEQALAEAKLHEKIKKDKIIQQEIEKQQKIKALANKNKLEFISSVPNLGGNIKTSKLQEQKIEDNFGTSFIEFPTLNITAPVNFDYPSDLSDYYRKMRRGLAVTYGYEKSVLPTEPGLTFISGHSSFPRRRTEVIPYLKEFSHLTVGDKIYLYGKKHKFIYELQELKLYNLKTEVSEIEGALVVPKTYNKLVILTCAEPTTFGFNNKKYLGIFKLIDTK